MRKTKCIFSNITEPALNVRLDEFILRLAGASDLFFVRFYTNSSSVVLGAHQCEALEVNRAYCARNGIKVVRRISGGGAVYHDEGNLNVAFAVNARFLPEKYLAENVRFFAGIIKNVLSSFGLNAELGTHNEVIINGKKVSGSASCKKFGGFLFHATLLLDADLEKMKNALRVSENAVPSPHRRCVRSNRAEVANLYDFKFIERNLIAERICEAFNDAFYAERGKQRQNSSV